MRRSVAITSKSTLLIALIVLSHAASTCAARHRFHEYFPNSEHPFKDISTGICNVSLTAYEDLYDTYSSNTWMELGINENAEIYKLCKDHENCILENASEVDKVTLSTAEVVLGVLPTLLAVLSPSLAEIALLAAQRPLLSILLSVGAPGVLQTRVFEYNDPGALLDLPAAHGNVRTTRVQLVLGPWPSGLFSALVALLEYIGVLAAAGNVLMVCVELSRKAILSWGCTRSWPPIVWALVPLFIHTLSAVGYRLTLDRKASSVTPKSLPTSQPSMLKAQSHSFFTNTVAVTTATDAKDPSQSSQRTGTTNTLPTAPSPELATSHPTSFHRILHALMNEFIPTAVHPPTLLSTSLTHTLPHPHRRVTVGILLHCIAGFLSFFHLLYGTVTFSGFMFINTLDAIGYVMMRLLASALICRFIVLVEIGGMRGARFGVSGMR